MVVLCAGHDWRPSVLVLVVDRSSKADEERGDLLIVDRDSKIKSSEMVAVEQFQVCTSLAKQLHSFIETSVGGAHQRGPSIVVLVVDVCAVIEEDLAAFNKVSVCSGANHGFSVNYSAFQADSFLQLFFECLQVRAVHCLDQVDPFSCFLAGLSFSRLFFAVGP